MLGHASLQTTTIYVRAEKQRVIEEVARYYAGIAAHKTGRRAASLQLRAPLRQPNRLPARLAPEHRKRNGACARVSPRFLM
ncbi:hypothetical protein [Caballeronia cordobensis]|uniref:hypothetical protein n=1 Tax=Caballeronia cordobensis TaxID=1353886 RepID=UPI0006AD78CA|nr:hypothetical protein [Caballeronia cordobensis]